MVNMVVFFVLFNYSSLYLEVGVNVILNVMVFMFGVIVVWLWLGDKLIKLVVVGFFVGFVGVIVIS